MNAGLSVIDRGCLILLLAGIRRGYLDAAPRSLLDRLDRLSAGLLCVALDPRDRARVEELGRAVLDRTPE